MKPVEPPAHRDGTPKSERPVEVPNEAVRGKRKHTKPLKTEPVGPIVCRPVGEMLLADVPGFPADVVEHLAAKAVRTLLDLDKHVGPPCKASPAWVAMTKLGVPRESRLIAEKALKSHLNIGSTVRFPEPEEERPPAKPLTDAADFDETTPPPRRRPPGTPIDMFTKIRPGSSAEAEFMGWDREGKVPAGSILAEPIRERGTLLGWRLLGFSATEPPPVLPAVGEFIPKEIIGQLKQWAVLSMRGDTKRNWYVLSGEGRD